MGEIEQLVDEIKEECRDTEPVEVAKPKKGKNKKKRNGKDKSNGVPDLKDSDQIEKEVEQIDEIKEEPKNTEPVEVAKPTKGKSKKKRKGKDKSNGVLNINDSDHSEPEIEELDEIKEEPVEASKLTKGKSKKKQKTKDKSNSVPPSDEIIGELQCAVCKGEFKSKNKLFSHLKESGHAVAK